MTPDGESDIVRVSLDGRDIPVLKNRSLLATLIAEGTATDYFCGIGQCFRCEWLIGGLRARACIYYPVGGEVVEAVTQLDDQGDSHAPSAGLEWRL